MTKKTPKTTFQKYAGCAAGNCLKKSSNKLPIIHRLVTDEYGENYWFNGCARYVMECLNEPDFDYDFFAGITGDVFAQYYPHGNFRGEGVSGYLLYEDPTAYLYETEDQFELRNDSDGFVEQTFRKCGYSSTFVTMETLCQDAERYLQTLISYIDNGIPVIAWDFGELPIRVLVGYEEYGKILLYITGNSDQPKRISLEKALESNIETAGWIFIGKKIKIPSLAEIYRERIRTLPKLLMTDTKNFCFGAGAFRAWADDIENGKFDSVRSEEFNLWSDHTAYVCGLATNASCCHVFLERAVSLNPDMKFLHEVSGLYSRCEKMWHQENGNDLEAIGGGFNVTLETLQNDQCRRKIAAKLREFAKVNDEIVRVLDQGLNSIVVS